MFILIISKFVKVLNRAKYQYIYSISIYIVFTCVNTLNIEQLESVCIIIIITFICEELKECGPGIGIDGGGLWKKPGLLMNRRTIIIIITL